MTYEDFKAIMDYRPQLPKSGKVPMPKERIFVLETCLTMLVTLDALSVQYVQKFHDMVKGSGSEIDREWYGTVQPFANDGKVRSMNNRLHKLIKQFEAELYGICKKSTEDDEAFFASIADAMDATEEVLEAPAAAYSRLLEKRISEGNGDTKPLDPKLLSALLRCIVFCDMSANVYDNITSKSNFEIVGREPRYKFLRLDRIFNQIIKMLTYMDFKDTEGKPLAYDLTGLKMSKESLEIADDIFHILYSAEYIGVMIKARSGRELKVGDAEFKSIIESFEKDTLPIWQYTEKYKNKYL